MKRLFFVFTASILAALLFTQCTKFNQCDDDRSGAVFNAHFYTTKANDALFLYIDNTGEGELPYFSQPPVCGQAYADGQQPFTISLKSGEYTIVGKDAQGTVTCQGIIKISKSKMSTSGNLGGLRLDNNNDDCLMIGLSE